MALWGCESWQNPVIARNGVWLLVRFINNLISDSRGMAPMPPLIGTWMLKRTVLAGIDMAIDQFGLTLPLQMELVLCLIPTWRTELECRTLHGNTGAWPAPAFRPGPYSHIETPGIHENIKEKGLAVESRHW